MPFVNVFFQRDRHCETLRAASLPLNGNRRTWPFDLRGTKQKPRFDMRRSQTVVYDKGKV